MAGKRSAAVQVKIPVTVKDGYHVNSNKPSEEYLIPLKLTWTQLGSLEGGTVTYPKPMLEKYEFSETPLSVFTGGFELVANFKVAANAPAGPGAVTGKLRYQACSNRACYPPQDGGRYRQLPGAVGVIQAKYPRNSTSRSESCQTGAKVRAHQDRILAYNNSLRTAAATLVSVIT